MKLPKAKLIDKQQLLFPKEDKSFTMGVARQVTGDFFEELTAACTRGTRLRTDCTADICPDVLLSNNVFVEVKAAGVSGSVIFYQDRHLNSTKFAATSKLVLFFWHHKFKTSNALSVAELKRGLAASIQSLTILSFSTFCEALKSQRLRRVNQQSLGWAIPIRRVQESYCKQVGYLSPQFSIQGATVQKNICVYCSNPKEQAHLIAAEQKQLLLDL